MRYTRRRMLREGYEDSVQLAIYINGGQPDDPVYMGVLPSLEYAQEFADTFADGYNGAIDDISADIGDINGNILFSKHYPSSKWKNHLANDWKKR